jgi:cytoskeletal protein CcmA (bactofilin family)
MENKSGSLMIGEGVIVNGNIEMCEDAHIYGVINGEIKAKDVVIGETGQINGHLVADNIEVRGKIQQNIEARSTLLVRSTGHVAGDIVYQSLEIESGGLIDGKLEKYNPRKEAAAEARASAAAEAKVTAAVKVTK